MPFLTEEGTQVLIFSLVCNFHCSTLYPPVCALGIAFYGIPATGRYKYPSSLRYPQGESLGAPAPVRKTKITFVSAVTNRAGPEDVTSTSAPCTHCLQALPGKLQFVGGATTPTVLYTQCPQIIRTWCGVYRYTLGHRSVSFLRR